MSLTLCLNSKERKWNIMSEVVLDECLYYLKEAEDFLNMYKELDPFEEIFEAYKPETQLKVDQNQKAKTGVMGSLSKACQAVITFIQNLIDSIKDFFEKRKLDHNARKAYEEFKAKCAKDPSLKHKKVTVKDFTKYNQEYEKLLAEAAEADEALAKGSELNLDTLFKKIKDFCGNTTKGIVVAVGMEAALNIASSSQEIAQNIYSSLSKDKALEEQLMQAVGKHETKKFERQMKSLGKRVSLHRLVMQMKGTYSKSVEEGISNTFETVWDIIGHAKNIANTTGDLDPDLAVKGNAIQRAKGTVSYIKNNFGTLVKDGGGAAVKGGDIAMRLMGNETIKQTAKDAYKAKSQMTKDARSEYQAKQKAAKARAKQAAKDAKKKKAIHQQSARDAFLASNDPNSLTYKVVNKLRGY